MFIIPWQLIWQFTKRDLSLKFHGSFVGIGWLLLTPLLTLLLFTFVFHGIFGMKWPGTHEQSAFSFALFLFVGLSVYQFFSEVINRSATLVLSQPNLVTKVVFPLWILPVTLSLSASMSLLVSLLLLLGVAAFYVGISLTWLWIPVILLPLLLGTLGGAWLFAAIGVYVRDIGQILGMSTTAMMFLSPIFYPLASVPAAWQHWFMLNPITLVVEPLRNVIMLHQSPDILWLLALYGVGIVFFGLGLISFTKLKKGFADVL